MGHFCSSGAFSIHTGSTPTLAPKQSWRRVSRIFPSLNFVEGGRRENCKKILDQFRAKCWLRGGVGGQFPRNLNYGEVPPRAPTPYPLIEKEPLSYTVYNRYPFYTPTFMDNTFGSFLQFWGVFNSHRLNPYPRPQAKLEACIQNFSEFELCRGWEEGELQENFWK